MKPTVRLPSYPYDLEDWWWAQATQKWPEHSEEKILNLIRKEVVVQSDRFNKSRSFDPQSYGSRELSLLTYGNFFFPRTWNAMTLALSEAYYFRSWKKSKKGPIRILDIGSGTGASGLSALSFLRNLDIENSISLEAWDYSGKSLSIYKNLHRVCYKLWPETDIKTQRIDLRYDLPSTGKQRYDLILLGFSINEFLEGSESKEHANWLREIFKLLSYSGFIVIVEPAEKKACDQLQSTAAILSTTEKDLYIEAPYFNGHKCPFFCGKTNYYSHEVRKAFPSKRIENINKPLGLETREVKFGLSILGRNPPRSFPKNCSFCRIVSPIRKKKGTLSFIGIAPDEIEYMYEIQRRSLSNEETKELLNLERGDIIKIENGECGKDPKRIRIHSFQSIILQFAPRWEKKNIDTMDFSEK